VVRASCSTWGFRWRRSGRRLRMESSGEEVLSGPDYALLVADIRAHGLLEPILVDAEGRILDGRNRYRACLESGVEVRFVEWHGQQDPAELTLSLNLRRRHLDESQRALLGARLVRLLEAAARKRRGERTGPERS